MLSRSRICLAVVLCLTIIAITCGAVMAGTVTVDFATKSGKSDVTTLDAKNVKVIGEQVGVHINSTLLTPQPVKIKFVGLKDQDYDAYVDGVFIGAKSAKELGEGIDRTIPGRVTDPAAMRMFLALNTKVPPAHKKIKARDGAEPWRAAYTLGQVESWVHSELREDEVYRSILVIIAPAKQSLEHMTFIEMRTASEVAASVAETCFMLQQARWNMYEVLTDPNLRNEVVEALTPVTLAASCSTKNGKLSITAVIVNDCNLPITGKITVSAPKGWKTTGGKFDIGKVESGRTFTTSFSLTRSAKNAAVPKSVPLTAVLDIADEEMACRLWLFGHAWLPEVLALSSAD
jgi:hypothetical protein